MVRTLGSSSVKSDSAQAGLKPFLQSGTEGKCQPNDCADMATPLKAGTGTPGMAQRAHTAHSDPSCQPGENALSSEEQFGVTFLTRPPARRAGILQEEALGSFHFAFCHCSTTVQPVVCTRHLLLLPERLLCLALGRAGVTSLPRPHGCGKVVSGI